MPPQGLLVMIAYLPRDWEVKLVDENIRPASDEDYMWADAVFITGMHVQRQEIDTINETAHRCGKLTVLGGPSVSSCPEYYPDVDILHVGELGDATDALIEQIDYDIERTETQLCFVTSQRLPMESFPVPAYEHVNLKNYFAATVQFSSGCSFSCEFCDIPSLYGRIPRAKTPEQVIAELDVLFVGGCNGFIHFVDDNFIGNPAAAIELLERMIEWQCLKGYPFVFACEATLTLAQHPDILSLMREAGFQIAFCGIESPDPEALAAINKKHNLRIPIAEAIQTINSYGLEIVGGAIIGFDTDTPDTVDRITEFVNRSHVPIWTVNILYALPNTPLYRRLETEGRIVDDAGRESNVDFLMPYEDIRTGWARCVRDIYSPRNLYSRFKHQIEHTYPNRRQAARKPRLSDLWLGFRILGNVMRRVGMEADYSSEFRKVALPLLRQGRVDDCIHVGITSHHLIRFAREQARGVGNVCLYTDPNRSRERSLQDSH